MARAAGKRARDPRLDFFRGAGMFIILLAHMPGNPLAEAIPARFGFSDATEIFVFCSGVASALAFGCAFESAGWVLGTARILHRVWQVYWAHIGVFLATIAVLAGADRIAGIDQYLRHDLNLWPLLEEPAHRLPEFLGLVYVPNYFDILPMYLVVLLLVPVVMAVARLGTLAVGLFVVGLWAVASTGALELAAETWSGRPWFFNPFSWQLVFFLGFSFGRGWLVAPGYDRRLALAAAAVLVAAAPFSCHYGWECYAGYGALPWLGEAHDALARLTDKTHLGVLRVVHFVALAYLAHAAAGEGGRRLSGAVVPLVSQVGRQTLAVFLAGLVLAQALGATLDATGRTFGTVALANLAGCAALVLVAIVVEWFKSAPWARVRAPAPAPNGAAVERADAVTPVA
jgi:hypothetical protein